MFKMLKKTLILTVVSSFISSVSYTQNALPNLLPPSPNSEEFKKFDEFKMSPVNGLPDISIPIHVIKVNGMEIPLNLSYHASGVKLKQTSGEVGVGWNLNSNYRISRTIFGRPDEHYSMPSDYDSLGQPAYVRDHYLAQFIGPGGGGQMPYSNTYLDGEYDVFSYGGPSASGLFIIGDRINKVIKPLELSLSKFSYINTPDSGILSISSVDPNGNVFDYGRDFVSNSRVYENSAGPGVGYKAPTAWPLMKIRTSKGGDEIRFNYYTTLVGSFQGEYNLFVAKEAARQSETDYHSFSNPNSESSPYSTFFTSSIVTKYEKIEFIRRSGTAELIDTIKVRTAAGNVIKYITFFYSTGGNFMFLDSIRIYGSSLQEAPQVYSFDYHNKSQNPNQLITDSWGYCKGGIPGNNYHQEFWDDQLYFRNGPCGGYPTVNLALLRVVMTDGVFNTRDGFDFQDSYSLKKITYPTGGTSEYLYESNKYINRHNVQIDGGGLRIKQIVKKDPIAGNTLVRDYAYGENENGIGNPIVLGGLGFWNFKDVNARLVWRIFGSACNLLGNWTPLVLANEYVYSIYPQGDVTSFISLASGNIRYPSVTEYFSSTTLGLKAGKIIYKYDTPDEVLETGLNVSGSVGYVYNFSPWNKPCLREQMTFAYENGSYRLVRKDSMEYLMAPASQGFQGLKVQTYASDDANGVYVNDPNSLMAYYDAINSWFKYGTYGISSGLRLLKEKHSFDYSPQGRLQNVEKYEYNTLHQLRSVTKLEQNGEVIVEESKYPADFPALTGADAISQGVKNLVVINALDEVVEQSAYKQAINGSNKRLLSSYFRSFYNTNPFLKAIYTLDKVGTITDFTAASVQSGAVVIDNRYKTELLFDNYNTSGKILQMHKQHDLLRSYKWTDQELFPVAEILNAAESQVFFSNMEEKNGWGIATGISYDQTRAHTGRVAMKINNPTGTKMSSHAGSWLSDPSVNERKYRYSGWVYSEGPAAEIVLLMKSASEPGYSTLVDNIQTAVTGKWIYVQKEIVVPGNISLLNIRVDNNGGGAVWFDDIRLHPATATMSTFTYDPLIGATSISDVNSRPTYYEYDSFGRLNLIRDQDRNIVKRFDYQFQTPTHRNAIWQATGNIRCKPCEANSNYSTDIAQKEERDVNPNSPTFEELRWVNSPGAMSCTIVQDWQNTASAIRCKRNGANEITGERERELKDMNPCSPSYNTLKWVVVDTNYTVCVPPNVKVSGSNASSKQVTLAYKNLSTNVVYTFQLNAGVVNASLGVVPNGNYQVTMTPVNYSATYPIDFQIAGLKKAYYNTVNFNNLSLIGHSQVNVSASVASSIIAWNRRSVNLIVEFTSMANTEIKYAYVIPANTTAAAGTYFGAIPSGVYEITMRPSSVTSFINYTYKLYGFSQSYYATVLFGNVNVINDCTLALE